MSVQMYESPAEMPVAEVQRRARLAFDLDPLHPLAEVLAGEALAARHEAVEDIIADAQARPDFGVRGFLASESRDMEVLTSERLILSNLLEEVTFDGR